jgi:hypothetical protein
LGEIRWFEGLLWRIGALGKDGDWKSGVDGSCQ